MRVLEAEREREGERGVRRPGTGKGQRARGNGAPGSGERRAERETEAGGGVRRGVGRGCVSFDVSPEGHRVLGSYRRPPLRCDRARADGEGQQGEGGVQARGEEEIGTGGGVGPDPGRTAGSTRETDAIRAGTAGPAYDHRAKRRVGVRGSGDPRGRHPIIGLATRPTSEDDEIMGRPAGSTHAHRAKRPVRYAVASMTVRRPRHSPDDRATAPPYDSRSHRLRTSALSFARGSDVDPAGRPMIVRRPRRSTPDLIVFGRRPRWSCGNRTSAPPVARSSYTDPAGRPLISSSSYDAPLFAR